MGLCFNHDDLEDSRARWRRLALKLLSMLEAAEAPSTGELAEVQQLRLETQRLDQEWQVRMLGEVAGD